MTAPILELEIEKYQLEHKRMLQELANRDKTIADKDQAIANNKKALAEKDQRIAELEKALAEKNTQNT